MKEAQQSLLMEIDSKLKDYVMEKGEGQGYKISFLNDYSKMPRVAIFKIDN